MGLNSKNKKQRKFKFSRQLESLDCAPACLKMISDFYGKKVSLSYVRELCKTNKLGTSLYSITRGANRLGFESASARINIKDITSELPLPAVLLWNKNHFVVLTEAKKKKPFFFNDNEAYNLSYVIADPGFGMLKLNFTEFLKKWSDKNNEGIIVFFEPSENFDIVNSDRLQTNPNISIIYFQKLKQLLYVNKFGLILIFAGTILTSCISLLFPVLTQRIVDIGLQYKSKEFILLISLFQLGLFISLIFIDAIKSWMLLHIGAKIEINLTYDFLSKIMRLPLYFFDTRAVGDIMQRVSDNGRIQNFIKSQLLDIIVAIGTLIALVFMILDYSKTIFLVYFLLSVASIVWAFHFVRVRELLDYRRFDATTESVDNMIETIVGMPEIKLNGAEDFKKAKWKSIQLNLFDINSKILKIQLFQNLGFTGINQLKNIIATLLAAHQVINGSISVGQMMAMSIIIGQLNVPLLQLVAFIQTFQDARFSFQRLAEIQFKKNEDDSLTIANENIFDVLNNFDSIEISNLDFSYYESQDQLLFNKLYMSIPRGKITAIVGESGSGKTTLMKIILKFYEPLSGEISIAGLDLNSIPASEWRSCCGVVLQEGHIFTDTIENNIAMSTDNIDRDRLEQAASIACITDFVNELPSGYLTKIGSGGIGLSTGQKQRILIARAVYKNPAILFFDEATSSLDSNNEKQIYENLQLFFENKTVLLIAHRLSTVQNAHNIIVLDSGTIVEQGSHNTLIKNKSKYYNLVKNQLQLSV